MTKHFAKWAGMAVLAALLAGPTPGWAGAVITFGETSLGVNNEGHLNFFGFGPGTPEDNPGESLFDPLGFGPYGLFRRGVGDATSPGCLCEGWGVAATNDTTGVRFSGTASVDNFPGVTNMNNVTPGTFGFTADRATSVVHIDNGLPTGFGGASHPMTVTHQFGPSLAPDVFQVQVTIENTSATDTLSDVVYRRAMDWDIPPTEFDEYVTHQGVAANLEPVGNIRGANDNGFNSVDPQDPLNPIDPATQDTDFVDNGPNDHGSVFDFAFGNLAPGASRIFNIFYGSAGNEADALSAIATLGATAYSLGQSNPDPFGPGPAGVGNPDGTPATYLFAFGGVGGVEPGSTPDVPILPFVPAPAEFEFPAPEPRRWFDPPFVDGFEYSLVGDPTAEFLFVDVPPAAFGFGPIDLVIGGVVVATLIGDGGGFDFLANGFSGVQTFSLVGIDPLLDSAGPGFSTAFPTFLDFTGSPTALTMSGIEVATVPEPSALLILAVGLIVLVDVRRRWGIVR